MSQTKEYYHEEIARLNGSAEDRFDYECAYYIDDPSPEEIAEIAAAEEHRAAQRKLARFVRDAKIDRVNYEIEEARELDLATREIQRRLSKPAKREDIEPIAAGFVAWRDLLKLIGWQRFAANLDLWLI